MKKVIILKGLPASGKSTWAKKQVDDNPGVYKRINKDDLRAMLDSGRWSKANENLILKIRNGIILESLSSGFHVIVDDTNLAEKHITTITQLVKGKAEVEVKEFECEVEECIKRDLKRLNSVGEQVIRNMYNQFLKPKTDKYLPPNGKRQAVIFDIDGTLAIMKDRTPFEWDKVGQDLPNEPVLSAYSAFKDTSFVIIVFSGRDACCRKQTEEWLSENDVKYDYLDMRPEGDTRKDSIVKKEMFDKIKDEYNIIGVFDDRDQVVEMWRSLGLTCFQVADGNF